MQAFLVWELKSNPCTLLKAAVALQTADP